MAVTLRKTRASDARALADFSKRAFDHDINYGAPGVGGPPGYDDPAWQERMRRIADYWVAERDGEMIGGIIVFPKGPGAYELGRIFVPPELQNQGLGAKMMAALDKAYPFASAWTLGTPEWNQRTQHFYRKMGFHVVGREGDDGVLFERRRGPKAG